MYSQFYIAVSDHIFKASLLLLWLRGPGLHVMESQYHILLLSEVVIKRIINVLAVVIAQKQTPEPTPLVISCSCPNCGEWMGLANLELSDGAMIIPDTVLHKPQMNCPACKIRLVIREAKIHVAN